MLPTAVSGFLFHVHLSNQVSVSATRTPLILCTQARSTSASSHTVYISNSCVASTCAIQQCLSLRLLQGLLTLVTCSKTSVVVAEAVIVLRQLLQQNPDFEGSGDVVRRLSVLLLQSFLDPSDAEEKGGGRPNEHDQGGGSGTVVVAGAARASLAQPGARASIIWTLGEYHQHISAVATDVLRVLAKAFPELEEEVKIQVCIIVWE